MYGFIFGVSAVLAGLAFLVGRCLFDYFKDPKGLRRYSNLDFFAGMTNIPFLVLAHKGFRSKRLQELHAQGIPVIRTGPNALSYGSSRAIKVCRLSISIFKLTTLMDEFRISTATIPNVTRTTSITSQLVRTSTLPMSQTRKTTLVSVRFFRLRTP